MVDHQEPTRCVGTTAKCPCQAILYFLVFFSLAASPSNALFSVCSCYTVAPISIHAAAALIQRCGHGRSSARGGPRHCCRRIDIFYCVFGVQFADDMAGLDSPRT
jgi:hypothetical protein